MRDTAVNGKSVMWRSMALSSKSLVMGAILGSAGIQAAWGDWAEFQGPKRFGVSPEKNLADQWPSGGPREMWQIDVGVGFGGTSVREGLVYFLDRQQDQRDVLRCLDLETGAEKWSYEHSVAGRVDFSGTRCKPTVDEEQVYAMAMMGQLYCVNRANGKEVWKLEVHKTFGAPPPALLWVLPVTAFV